MRAVLKIPRRALRLMVASMRVPARIRTEE
jgi:hypothetical protein